MAKRKQKKILQQPISTPIESKNKWSKFEKGVTYISILIAIGTGIVFFKDRWFKSDKDKQIETEKLYTVEGELNIPKIPIPKVEYKPLDRPFVYETKFDNLKFPKVKGLKIKYYHPNEMIAFVFGPTNYVFVPIKNLLTGVIINVHKFNGCDDTQFKFGIHNERLYVSTEFKDLQQERTIGIIEFNKWKLFSDNYCTVHSDDKGFEVTDKQHYIVFTMRYDLNTVSDSGNVISIGGYFISPSSIRVIQNYSGGEGRYYDTCFSKSILSWKQKSEINIAHLKTNFP